MAYISDINHDVRTEGMSYGLMIAVQFDRKDISIVYGGGARNICSIRRDC